MAVVIVVVVIVAVVFYSGILVLEVVLTLLSFGFAIEFVQVLVIEEIALLFTMFSSEKLLGLSSFDVLD